ncbi:MAG: flavodoxin family protein [Oscillospiraceae bacterium]|nr:flavodoxin family protein [Oscillospiraceae bacterium]
MKVLLVNGSPNEHGCTYTALQTVASALHEQGVETEIFWIGKAPIGGCMACTACRKLGKCIQDDVVNTFAEKARQADGFVFGSPVHYAALSGNLTAFMDRAFYSAGKDTYRYKPAAGVLSARRAGTTAAFDQINEYFTINEMPIVSSRYWNMVHGAKAEDVLQDAEGVACMRQLGKNMAYLLSCMEAGKKAGITPPEQEPLVRTNFIR